MKQYKVRLLSITNRLIVMRAYVTVCFSVLLIQVVVSSEDYKKESDWCIHHYNLNPEEIYRIHKGPELPTNNRDYSEFFECFWRKIGFLDEQGEINRPVIWQMYYTVAREVYNTKISRYSADSAMRKCEHITGATPVLRALNMGNCLKNVSL